MIYAISGVIQPNEIEKHCHPCGGLTLEGINLGEWGPFCACYQEDCPHESKRTPVIGNVHGDDVCVRRLEGVGPPAKNPSV